MRNLKVGDFVYWHKNTSETLYQVIDVPSLPNHGFYVISYRAEGRDSDGSERSNERVFIINRSRLHHATPTYKQKLALMAR